MAQGIQVAGLQALFAAMVRTFLFTSTFTLALEPTRPPVQWEQTVL